MNNHIKIKAKQLLYKNTLPLFLISLLSLVLRCSTVAVIALAPATFIGTGLFKALCSYTGATAGVVISAIIYFFLSVALLCLAVGVSLGERWIYLQRLNNVTPKIRFLFKFLSPKITIRALCLYTKVFFLKVMWLLYFMMPPLLCMSCAFYLLSRGADTTTVFIPALAGAVLLSAALVLSGSVFARYSQAALYMCSHKNASAKASLKFSIDTTDSHLNDRTVLHFSLTGWLLSCVFLIPVIYTVPYIKLCNIIFAEECRKLPSTTTEYAVNILRLHPNI